MKRLMTGLVLMAVFAGCASAPKLAPKAGPDEVRVFYANSGVEPEATSRGSAMERAIRGPIAATASAAIDRWRSRIISSVATTAW